jgi:ubiquitin conjugation factor E4 B
MVQTERQATSCMSLGNETVHMLQVLTGNPEIVEPFMASEVVGRLAAMLDYNLVALSGPKCSELKVKNPEKYRFEPKSLLHDLVLVFLHLAHRPEFVQAVATDERSYNAEVFAKAASILLRNNLFSQVIGTDIRTNQTYSSSLSKMSTHVSSQATRLKPSLEKSPTSMLTPSWQS